MKKPKQKKKNNSKFFYLSLLALISLAIAIYYVGTIKGPQIRGNDFAHQYEEKLIADINKPARPIQRKSPEPTPESLQPGKDNVLPRLAIIIDDIGFNDRYEDLMTLPFPVTFAIIPSSPNALDAAEKGEKAGMELMMHIPMEPQGYPDANPGKYALFTTMGKREIMRNLNANLKILPHVKGVNNHMGSRFTEYPKGMKIVLREIKKRGLYFIDSRTTYNSVAYSLAKKMGVRAAERTVFLDNVQTEEAIREQFMEAIRAAKENGSSIAIGHPHKTTVSVLLNMAPTFKENKIELVFASSLVD